MMKKILVLVFAVLCLSAMMVSASLPPCQDACVNGRIHQFCEKFRGPIRVECMKMADKAENNPDYDCKDVCVPFDH